MSKHSTHFKLQVVQDYLQFGGQKRVARKYQVSHSEVRTWSLAYQAHGLASLQKRTYQHYTPEFKLSVLRYIKDEQVSLRLAAVHFDIATTSTITVWRRLYNEGGLAALQAQPKGRPPMPKAFDIKVLLKKPISELTLAEMRRRLEYSEAESAYLKKLEALAQRKTAQKKQPK